MLPFSPRTGVVRAAEGSRITLAEPLPGAPCGRSGSRFYNDNTTGPGFAFLGNRIQSRRFGVLCMGRDGIIEGNTFTDNPGPAIFLTNDDDYDDPAEERTGWMPRNIVIRNNTFLRGSRCVPDPFHAGMAESLTSVIVSAVYWTPGSIGRSIEGLRQGEKYSGYLLQDPEV